MITDFHVDTQVNCAFILQEGEYEKGEGVDILYRLAEVSAHKPGMNIYRDLKNCEFHPDYNYRYFKDNIKPDLAEALPRLLGHCKVGWLVGSARDYSIVHQIGVSGRLSPGLIERRPYRDKIQLM